MTHAPFLLIANMRGPLSITGPLHLDGLLLAAREKRCGVEHRDDPFPLIAVRDGVYQASAGFLVQSGLAGARKDYVERVRRLNIRSQDGQMFQYNTHGPAKERVIDAMSPFRATLAEEPFYANVAQVVFQALGDRDAVLELVSDEIASLGKMHRTGWGAVDDFETEDCDADPAYCGLAAHDQPLRNLPLPLARSLGLDCSQAFHGRTRPPYMRRTDDELIVGPSMADIMTDRIQVRQLQLAQPNRRPPVKQR